MESEDLPYVSDSVKKFANPDMALVITQNEKGEIIDTRVIEVDEAFFILRQAKRGKVLEEKLSEAESASDGSWWSPGT